MYNWLISLLPPIVLDNLFGSYIKELNTFQKPFCLAEFIVLNINGLLHQLVTIGINRKLELLRVLSSFVDKC